MKLLILFLILCVYGCTNTTQSSSNAMDGLVSAQKPNYPSIAVIERKSGIVKVQYDIDDEGNTYNIKIIQAWPAKIFNQSAIDAISNMKYVQGHPRKGVIFNVRYHVVSLQEIEEELKAKRPS